MCAAGGGRQRDAQNTKRDAQNTGLSETLKTRGVTLKTKSHLLQNRELSLRPINRCDRTVAQVSSDVLRFHR